MINKDSIKKGLLIILACALMWIPVSSTIQAFKCPEMTRTQLFLHIYKSYIGEYKTCKSQN